MALTESPELLKAGKKGRRISQVDAKHENLVECRWLGDEGVPIA